MKRLSKDEQLRLFKKIKTIRSIAKNTNYAAQYGAGASRIAITANVSAHEAKNLHETYWKRNWAIKAVAEEQKVKEVDGQMWLKNPVNGFWYSLRTKKDIFSTLVQGTASYCFDIWLRFVLSKRPQVTGQFHDEFIIEVRKGNREKVTAYLRDAIRKTNEFLKLNRELDISIQFGDSYAEIH
jgi:DNA polymerase I-like protein with 3'-5' exonuclease and polymerase domains